MINPTNCGTFAAVTTKLQELLYSAVGMKVHEADIHTCDKILEQGCRAQNPVPGPGVKATDLSICTSQLKQPVYLYMNCQPGSITSKSRLDLCVFKFCGLSSHFSSFHESPPM